MRQYEKETRKEVLDIAIHHFSKFGYAGANLELIGKEAGLTRGPLYYYFKNKKELYIAAVNDELERTMAGFYQIFEQDISIFEKIKQDLIFCSNNTGLIEQVGKGGKDEPKFSGLEKHSKVVYELKYTSVLRAMEKGELRSDIDPVEMTKMIYVCFHGLKAVAKNELAPFERGDEFMNEHISAIVEMFKSRYGKL